MPAPWIVKAALSGAVLLLAAALVGLVTYSELQHLLRLRRARALQPGQRLKGEVAVGGTVRERTFAAPSGIEATTAAWQISWLARGNSDSRFDTSPLYRSSSL